MPDSKTAAPKGKIAEWVDRPVTIVSGIVTILGALAALHLFPSSNPPVVIHFFDTKPAVVKPGGLAVLSWNVENAERVVIEPSTLIGEVQPQGSRQVPIKNTTTFTLRAYASGLAPAPLNRTVQVTKAGPDPTPKPVSSERTKPPVENTLKQPTGGQSAPSPTVPVPPPHSIPRVVVLTSQLSSNSYAPSLVEEATESLRENLRNRGFVVLATPNGVQSIEQFASQYHSLAATVRVPDGPDVVAQLSLQLRQEQRQSATTSVANAFLSKLTKAQPANTVMDLISTCSASVNVIHLPEGSYVARGQSDDIRALNSVDTKMAGWQSAQNDVTIGAARRAIAQALNRLALHP